MAEAGILMALVEVLDAPEGSTKELRTMDASEGRHYCSRCLRLLRVGDQFVVETHPKSFDQEGTGFFKAFIHRPLCEER